MSLPVKISRILHAGYVFECDNTHIAFDPIFENPFSRNCYAFPNIRFDHEKIKKLKFSAVFISHYHDDHCSLVSLNLLDRQTPIYIYCIFEELASMIKELGFIYVYQLQIDTPINVGPFDVIPRRALDEDVDSIFQIKAAELNVLNVVDSWIDDSTLKLLALNGPWDLVLWPFQTMRELEVLTPSRASDAPAELPTEWIEQLKILNPKYLVPSSCQFIQESWSWYNHAFFPISYKNFNKQIKTILPKTQIVRLNPSVSIVLNRDSLALSSPLSWIQPIGVQDVDYDYKPNLKPPLTAEIAQHFEALTLEQSEKVYEYCRTGLIDKYKSLEHLEEETYFKKTRFWLLSLYDHKGNVTNFCYSLQDVNIELLFESKNKFYFENKLNCSSKNFINSLSWSTEVPISKLYAALECGETLTSMYIRINDRVFNTEVEKEMQTVDIIEDPLIRCLFNGVFGAYQRNQLQRLKNN